MHVLIAGMGGLAERRFREFVPGTGRYGHPRTCGTVSLVRPDRSTGTVSGFVLALECGSWLSVPGLVNTVPVPVVSTVDSSLWFAKLRQIEKISLQIINFMYSIS